MFLAQDFFARAVDFVRSSESLEDRTLDLFNLSSFISIEPLRQLLNEHISLGSIRRSDKILRIIATNWETGEVNLRMLTIQFAIKIKEDIETVNWINQGLKVLERVRREDMVSDGDIRDFIRVAGRIERRLREGSPYKKVTVHRYRLREDLGGITGFFNFSRKRIADLIDLGFDLACQYDPVTQSLIPQ